MKNLHVIIIINRMVDIFPEEQLMLTNCITRGHSLRYLQLPTKMMFKNTPSFPVLSRYEIVYLQTMSDKTETLDWFKYVTIMYFLF